jgi:hypothetical protein
LAVIRLGDDAIAFVVGYSSHPKHAPWALV